MTEKKNTRNARPVAAGIDAPEAEIEAALAAGGEIVGTTDDEELLVEGPNSK